MTDDSKRGLYSKYDVFHADDGHPVDEPCFVLKPESDPAAWYALRTYAVCTPNALLAKDINAWLERIGPPPEE